jgi:microcystin degradation protein MlrC
LKFGLGRISQFSNTFARGRTSIEDFRATEWCKGEVIVRRYTRTESVVGGILSACSDHGIETEPVIATSAPASGPLTERAFGRLRELTHDLFKHFAGSLDGVILEMSGAMLVENHDDAEATLIRTIRESIGDVPIAVVLHPWANVSDTLLKETDVLLGISPPPDLDSSAAGRFACDLLVQATSHDQKLFTRISRLPMVVPAAAWRSDVQPLSELMRDPVFDHVDRNATRISLFSGVQVADVPHAGATIVATGIGNPEHVDQSINQIANHLTDLRRTIRIPARNAEEAIHDAMASREYPSVLVDLGDDPSLGGPGDGTTLLWTLIDLGVRDAVLASIRDPEVVAACVRAGVNARVEIPLGGRLDTRHGYPIDVRARVKTVSDGQYIRTGPVASGCSASSGATVVLTVEARHGGSVDVIVTEHPHEASDLGFFDNLGINPLERQIVALKSTTSYLSAFQPIASAIHQVLTPGITTPDPAFYDYRRIPRPLFPIDQIDR